MLTRRIMHAMRMAARSAPGLALAATKLLPYDEFVGIRLRLLRLAGMEVDNTVLVWANNRRTGLRTSQLDRIPPLMLTASFRVGPR